MIQIRKGVFETNSSSTHSLTMCSDDEFKRFEKGELVFDRYSRELVTFEEVKDKYPEVQTTYDLDEYCCGHYYSWDGLGGDYYEVFHSTYITKSGEKIHAFGYYGSDY